MGPHTPLEQIFRLSPLQKKALVKLKLKTAEDLLRYFPIRYGEQTHVKAIEFLNPSETVTIYGKIKRLETKKGWKSKMAYGEAVIEDDTGSVKAIWFNQPYIAKMFGEESLVRVEGKVSQKKSDGSLYFSNPKVEKVGSIPEGVEDSLFGVEEGSEALAPVYSESRGISSNWIYYAIQRVLKLGLTEKIPDPIAEFILKKYSLPTLHTAFFWIHSPKKKEMAEAARKRFAFEEIFFIQLDRVRERKLAETEPAFKIQKTKKQIKEFTDTFPFPLTGAQENAIDTIINDLNKGHPMSRLLEGDVGSGKTAVAAALAYAIVTTPPPGREYGSMQVAYMAPTEILAEQHFESFIENFSKYKLDIGLITGSGAKKFPSKTTKNPSTDSGPWWTDISKNQLLKWVAEGKIPILIGTHSLIEKKVVFKNLAGIIIDEQHRFGVNQRQKLRRKPASTRKGEPTRGGHDVVPHLLSMTATPIPRTLALTIFGDLDLTVLDKLPAGRKPVITQVVMPHERTAVYEKIRKEIEAGRQAYVICPRIDEPDRDKEVVVEAKSVIAEAKRLKEKVFPELQIGILHGKMNPKEKEEVMRRFKNKEYHILVATSVVEVGVNVPNATSIIIEGAERFGLAQLHQLRGRVVRSSHQAYCYVFTESKSQNTFKRLKSFVTAKNGFELAEFDLQHRGAGDLAGAKQWGVSDLAMEALKNLKMVEAARTEATALIEKDFELKKYPLLAKRVLDKTQKIHME